MQVEGKSYRLHSYHLKRASKIFSDMYLLPKSTRAKKHVEGATPLDVKAEDFMNLIWYFYESPYEWYARLPLIKPPLLNLLKDSHRPGSLYFPSQMGIRPAPRGHVRHGRGRAGRHLRARPLRYAIRYAQDRTLRPAPDSARVGLRGAKERVQQGRGDQRGGGEGDGGGDDGAGGAGEGKIL